MIDELDLLPADINFGHFIRIVHESLRQQGLSSVTLVLAGQRGIYARLLKEDPSSERVVRHCPIAALAPEEARYVLEYAADHADRPFAIETGAAEMILALSAGCPYDIHLLGDAAFNAMEDPTFMTPTAVLRGLADLFHSDKREKYLERLRALTADERLVIMSLVRYPGRIVPMQIPLAWIEKNLLGRLTEGQQLESVLDSLVSSRQIVIDPGEGRCQFVEELFRVFTSLLISDQKVLDERKVLKKVLKDEQRGAAAKRRRRATEERRFIKDMQSDVIDDGRIDEVVASLTNAEYEADWEEEDHSSLIEFKSDEDEP